MCTFAACNCNSLGSVREDCEQQTGRCMCHPGVTGQKCNLCSNGKRLSSTGCTGRSPINCFYLLTFFLSLSVCLSVSFSLSCSRVLWRGLRTSELGQDRSDTKKSVLVLQVWCCVVKRGLFTFVFIIILKYTTTFQLLFMVFLFSILCLKHHNCGDQQWRLLT